MCPSLNPSNLEPIADSMLRFVSLHRSVRCLKPNAAADLRVRPRLLHKHLNATVHQPLRKQEIHFICKRRAEARTGRNVGEQLRREEQMKTARESEQITGRNRDQTKEGKDDEEAEAGRER